MLASFLLPASSSRSASCPEWVGGRLRLSAASRRSAVSMRSASSAGVSTWLASFPPLGFVHAGGILGGGVHLACLTAPNGSAVGCAFGLDGVGGVQSVGILPRMDQSRWPRRFGTAAVSTWLASFPPLGFVQSVGILGGGLPRSHHPEWVGLVPASIVSASCPEWVGGRLRLRPRWGRRCPGGRHHLRGCPSCLLLPSSRLRPGGRHPCRAAVPMVGGVSGLRWPRRF